MPPLESCCLLIHRCFLLNLHAFILIFIIYLTCSSPRRTFFLHALSFECTSKLCITFLNQFSVYFRIFKMHNTILSLNCVVRHSFFKNNLQLFIKFTHSFLAIELLTFCKNVKKLFYCSRELSLFWLNK